MTGPTAHDLIDEIARLLGVALSPALCRSATGSDLYEYYLAGLLISAACSDGAGLHYEDTSGGAPKRLEFRRSPGSIYSTNRYTHAVLELRPQEFVEVHLGIWATGKSHVPSEYDVSVVHREEAIQCRIKQRDVRSAKVELGIEAKFYSGRLGLNVARSFVGLVKDSSAKQGLSLMTNSTLSDLAGKLVQHHRGKGTWREEVLPGSTRAAEVGAYFTDLLRKTRPR
jgi:hypothetical protein